MSLTTKEFRDGPTWRRIALIAGIGLLMVGVLAVAGGGDDPQESASPGEDAGTTTTSEATGTATATTSAKGSLVPQTPTPARNEAYAGWLTAAPQGISWQRVDGVPLPFSASDGPTRIDGAVAEGYTQTPQGAVVAAFQIGMRMVFSPDFHAVVSRQTAISDAERTQLIEARGRQPKLDASTVQAVTLQPAAFKLGSYSATDATIYFAYPTDGPHFRIARMAVTWAGGDWKYTGRMAPDAPALPDAPDLDGFTDL